MWLVMFERHGIWVYTVRNVRVVQKELIDMNVLSTSEAREHFSDVINLVAFGKKRQILSRRGKELVAIIPIEELRWMEELENFVDLKEAKAALRSVKSSGAESWEKVKEELDL